MVCDNDEPADLVGFRAQREERKRERRRQKAIDNLTLTAPDCGREIPPRLNPDILDMVDRVKSCYVDITGWIRTFEEVVCSAVLPNAGKLDPSASEDLLGHYRELEEVVDAALTYTLSCPAATPDSRGRIPDDVHRLADHAKYVYAIGSRDIAAMQYKLAEMAGAGRIDHEVQEGLQCNHCLPMWETLYLGTTCAVRDDRTWDGVRDWSENTYSDGRQVMTQARVKNWFRLDRDWPYNEFLCADGPIWAHPRGSLCQIAVVNPDGAYFYLPVEIDLEALIDQLGPAPLDANTLDDLALAMAQESLLLEPPRLGRRWEEPDDAAMIELSNELANENSDEESRLMGAKIDD